MPTTPTLFALGIDAGGTQTRWALLSRDGEAVGTGYAAGLSGMQMHASTGRATVRDRLAEIANQLLPFTQQGSIRALVAGVTGVGAGNPDLTQMLSDSFNIPLESVSVVSDIEIAYHAAFAPGEGYLVYAGTGSIAAYIDEAGVLHRAGGRGVQLDDAGGGYWIASEALRRIWRREDESPNAWRESPLARSLFENVGGDSSICASRFLVERDRGEIGLLAISVAQCADSDPLAAEVLADAGSELARLGNALLHRYGNRKIVAGGRAAHLHPLIEAAMRSNLAAGAVTEFRSLNAHSAAARLALERITR